MDLFNERYARQMQIHNYDIDTLKALAKQRLIERNKQDLSVIINHIRETCGRDVVARIFKEAYEEREMCQ